jgi:DNA modification methylase
LTPILEDDWLTIYGGDNREVMRTLPDESVQCVVTSPPYWGLRDYGTASWDGGDPECDHLRPVQPNYRDTCGKCGAIRQDRQLGLEQTPEEYVAAMVDVFREVRRVLRKDGTLWLNLGDSYAGGAGGRGDVGNIIAGVQTRTTSVGDGRIQRSLSGLKPKDLVGIPWRVAFALQADGWYLRSDVIWAKPNPMPESVTDRPTKSHEYLFLLSKSATYHYDADAVREGFAETTLREYGDGRLSVKTSKHKDEFGHAGLTDATPNPAGRNRRSVWTVATKPYPGAHFATFPEALVEPCILAGTSEAGACGTCGAPWERVVERAKAPDVDPSSLDRYGNGDAGVHRKVGGQYQKWLDANPPETTGFRRTCSHDGPTVPCVVLDPFAGTGTVGAVAQRLSRRALLIDLNPDYLRQCLTRNQQTPLGLGH